MMKTKSEPSKRNAKPKAQETKPLYPAIDHLSSGKYKLNITLDNLVVKSISIIKS